MLESGLGMAGRYVLDTLISSVTEPLVTVQDNRLERLSEFAEMVVFFA